MNDLVAQIRAPMRPKINAPRLAWSETTNADRTRKDTELPASGSLSRRAYRKLFMSRLASISPANKIALMANALPKIHRALLQPTLKSAIIPISFLLHQRSETGFIC